jgi:mRNA interferase YafQ
VFEISFSKQSRKSLKRLKRSGRFDQDAVSRVISTLATGRILDSKYENHHLKGEFADCSECHIKNDLLLIYKIDAKNGILGIIDIGSHSELFG